MKLNHALLSCMNIAAMEDFFTRIMGFTDGPRPPFPFEGSWLYSDNLPVLHLVSSSTSAVSQQQYLQPVKPLNDLTVLSSDCAGQQLIDHLAFQGDDYNALIQRLDQHQATYFERTVPLSNEHQVFIVGPEQLKLEILFSQNKTPLP
ncbi:hypothetical protein [Aliamphritea ceti]|uniref:hypothetical protein n=1 Tax=Aliamphritea ceti TaxID=1524258 RepID=UPI0021C3BE7F|nr:hypothetical protein [Aliamphritea ceti]